MLARPQGDGLVVTDQGVFDITLLLQVEVDIGTEAGELTQSQSRVGRLHYLIGATIDVDVKDLVFSCLRFSHGTFLRGEYCELDLGLHICNQSARFAAAGPSLSRDRAWRAPPNEPDAEIGVVLVHLRFGQAPAIASWL